MKKLLLSLSLLICHSMYGIASEEVLKQLSLKNVQLVEFCFFDLSGDMRSLFIPHNNVKNCLKHGINFDGSSIPGYSTITDSDLTLKPDLETFIILKENESARIICDVYEDENIPYQGDPRYVLKQAIVQAEALGYRLHVGPEMEFLLFNKDNKIVDMQRYFDASNCHELDTLKKMFLGVLINNKIPVEKIHHEVAPGQYEVSIRYADALHIADLILLTKHLIKREARRLGLQATFMPKPLAKSNGNGMHINMSLHDIHKKENAFYDAQDSHHLSMCAQHFIAGILHYIQDITLTLNPTVNSFKRLLPGYEAPIFLCWGEKNRSALIRIPRINTNQSEAARIELRSPDPSCNPYIVFATILQAGLAGITKEMKLMPATEKNVYHLSEKERKALQLKKLPSSLEQSLKEFTDSSFAFNSLGACLYNNYTSMKQSELDAFNTAVTNWELETYFK